MKKIAFTLAEILTVLTLMGTIFALIIPNTVINAGKQKKLAMLKKLYSSFEINIQTVLAESNCTSISCLRKYGNKTLRERINANESLHNGAFSSPNYFIVHSECSRCLEAGAIMPPAMNTAARNYAVFRLTNGAVMALYDYEGNCTRHTGEVTVATEAMEERPTPDGGVRMERVKYFKNANICGIVVFDVNNMERPNVPGKDRFAYYIVDEAIDGSYLVPFGYSKNDDAISKSQYNQHGIVQSSLGGDLVGCRIGDSAHPEYGYNCTAKIMLDGWKMEY